MACQLSTNSCPNNSNCFPCRHLSKIQGGRSVRDEKNRKIPQMGDYSSWKAGSNMGDLPKEVTRITRPDANKHLTNIQNVSCKTGSIPFDGVRQLVAQPTHQIKSGCR
jgi:hypothetical protein